MPVLEERGRGFRGHPDGLDIGIVNNMPDAALESTERQFLGLLAQASETTQVRVRLFALPGVPRGEVAKRRIALRYADIADLWNGRLDGLIVTGTEPRDALAAEPYWADLTRLVDWASESAASSIWSCLAARAAVLHLDGIDRVALSDKRFGVFRCRRTADHALMAASALQWEVPHSRWNDLPEKSLTTCGYSVLSGTDDIGADMFVKELGGLFVFLQGHPEYESSTLLREYRRDVGRFLRGERSTFPAQPQRYFEPSSAQALDVFRTRAMACRDERLMESFPATAIRKPIMDCCHVAAVRLHRNWLACIASRRAAAIRAVPARALIRA
jgi:homoserine O-succinyltransferase/O-acetyltransferase